MHFLSRHFCLLLLLFASCIKLNAQMPCITVTINGDDSICAGTCSTLDPDITGPAGTLNYATQQINYAPYPFTGGNPVLVNVDDLWTPAINIPFCFEFYGTVYNQLLIGTNGLISFDIAQANGVCPWTITAPVPSPSLPMNCIMAPFHDINPMLPTAAGATEINWQVYGAAPCRTFVVTWNDIAQFGVGCDTLASTSQVVLHESTYIIDIFIADKPSCAAWNGGYAIEGLQNSTGTLATVIPGRNFPWPWAVSNDGVRFRPAGPLNVTYQWLDASNTVIGTSQQCMVCPTQTTTYTLNVTLTTCAGPPLVVSTPITITVVPTTLTAIPVSTQPLCLGICDGTASVVITSGQGPFSYSWTPQLPSVPNQTNLCPGSYNCTVIDANGCPVHVVFNLSPIINFSVTTTSLPASCNTSNGLAAAIPTGGTQPYTYQWNTGDTTSSLTNVSSGYYSVIVTDSMGCNDTVMVQVQSNGLSATYTTISPLCFGDSTGTATVTPVGGNGSYTYQWAPYGGNQATATGLCGGNFACLITDSSGCVGMCTFTITTPPPLLASPSANTTICLGQSVTISVTGSGGTAPYTYSWSNSLPPQTSNTITPSQTDTYSVYITDANGCVSPLQATQVKVSPLPLANFYSDEAQCPPALVPFHNLTDSAVTYIWNFGDPSSGLNDSSSLQNPSHVYATTGSYNVTLIAINVWGCADTIVLPSVVIPVSPVAALSAPNQTVSILDPISTFFNSSTGAIDYCIYFGDGDSLCTSSAGPYVHSYDSVGTYTVMLVAWNVLGCPDTTWTEFTIEEPTSLYIPNAFTPNGSGVNDMFLISGINVETFRLLIFDRWGMLIFSTDDVLHGWDGTFEGNKCQEDVYVWKLHYTDNIGGEYDKVGHVSLIR
jgi:gliding motility-associated-like protein